MSFDLIVSASTLQDYVDTLRSTVEEATLQFHENNVYSEAVDPGNVCMVACRLHASACEHYEADGMAIGVNLERFDDYLSKADSDDLVHLTYDEEKRRIGIEYGDVDIDMAGIDPDSVREGQTLPDDAVDGMTTDVTMDGAAFSHAIDITGMASDHITFNSDPGREEPLHITAEGDTDDVSVEFSEALHEGSEVNQASGSLFSEAYLDNITGTIPKSAEVRIQHGEEWPARFTYELPDADVDVEFGLAPRIQSN